MTKHKKAVVTMNKQCNKILLGSKSGFEELAKTREIPLNSIMSHAWNMKKNAKSEDTIKTAIARLKRLSKLCNLEEPEEVKGAIARMNWKQNTKKNMTDIYTGYLKFIGKTWDKPHYKTEHNLPFIPTEEELDALINAGRPKTTTLLQILKETGARIGEMEKLYWQDIDFKRRTIKITAEKGSNSRYLPISTKLIGMLHRLPKTNERVFPQSKDAMRHTIEALRNRTATKLGNPRLKKVHAHTFRHWKGTTEYHKMRDILHVQTTLGHKSIKSTMLYINLENALFQNIPDDFTCRIAKTIKEDIELIESGFEYVTERNGHKIYRKRK